MLAIIRNALPSCTLAIALVFSVPSVHAIEELTDAELTLTSAQAAGADFDNFTLELDQVELSYLFKHFDQRRDFAFVMTNLDGKIVVTKIGLDSAKVANGAAKVPAIRLTMGTATVDANGLVTSTTGTNIAFTNLGFDGLFITESKGRFSDDNVNRNLFVAPAADANPLFGMRMNGNLRVFGAVKIFQTN